MSSTQLFWSRCGEVACDDHRPDRTSRAWLTQGWAELPADAPRLARYQCQYCLDSPIRHTQRTRWDRPRPLVLSVDPDDARAGRRARELRHQGFIVRLAADETAAFLFARRVRPNLMVVGASGRIPSDGALCARLKAHPLLAYVPTVLVAATLDDISEVAEACLLEEESKRLGQILLALLSIYDQG